MLGVFQLSTRLLQLVSNLLQFTLALLQFFAVLLCSVGTSLSTLAHSCISLFMLRDHFGVLLSQSQGFLLCLSKVYGSLRCFLRFLLKLCLPNIS